MDANATMLRLRALHVMGHSCARIASAAGAHRRLIQRITGGQARTVTAALAGAVAQVYDRWWDQRAPERTRAERAAAATARGRARRGGWCPPAALDDDQLDRPRYQPPRRWRPATGTSTATEPPIATPPGPAAGPGPAAASPGAPGGVRQQPRARSGVPAATTAAEPPARTWAGISAPQPRQPPGSALGPALPPRSRQARDPGRSPRAGMEAHP